MTTKIDEKSVAARALMLTVGIQLSGFPPDRTTGLAMIRSGIIGAMCVNGMPANELRAYIATVVESLVGEPAGGLSIDAALADAKAHATKPTTGSASVTQNYDGDGSPL